MWIEGQPTEGQTVKIIFAEWTKLGTKIGILLKYFDGAAVVDFGKTKRYLDKNTTFYIHTS